jgi:hypothetical protein
MLRQLAHKNENTFYLSADIWRDGKKCFHFCGRAA